MPDKDDAIVQYAEPIQTATWTNYLPEAFGIRAAVQASKYRWCARESALWGIATGTAMTLHRFRMQSRTSFAVNVGFGSLSVVYVGSYYFCVRRRQHQEKMVGLLMQLNQFEHASEMPEPLPIDEHHPFVRPVSKGDTSVTYVLPGERLYEGNLPEPKEWQAPIKGQEMRDVLKPVEPRR
jgi:Protein of unknown function (DUF3767)